MLIRHVKPEDAEDIRTIYNHYVLNTDISFETEEVSLAEMTDRIREISSVYPYFVCEDEGHVKGYCYAHPWKARRAYEHTLEISIYLTPGMTNAGIGTKLLERVLEETRGIDVHSLIACITATNKASISFFTAHGFRKVSYFKEVGYKSGRWLDVTDLELIL